MKSGPPFFIVAIDGGAASGKSSTSRMLSERFNLLHSDTGSYYRTLTAEMLRQGASPERPASVESALLGLKLDTRIKGRSAAIEISGGQAGEDIRSREVNEAVSHFAAMPQIRNALLPYQRSLADLAKSRGFAGLVMEGRDIGSVIFPQADFRFFLTADPSEAERRRRGQGQQDRIAERDRLDSSRKAAPLAQPPGAQSIDTTRMTLAEVAERMASLIEVRFKTA